MSTYYIIGADEREYGPTQADELRQWIRQHRADAATRVRLEGEAGWDRLGNRSEFLEVLAEAAAERPASPMPRSLPPVAPSVGALSGAGEELAAAVLARGYDLQIGECFSRGWELLVGRFRLLVGATALVYLLYFGIWSIPGIGVGAAIVLSFVLLAGLNLLFLKELRGEPVDISMLFAGFNSALLPLLLAGTVATTLVLVGTALCIVPGIYLVVAWHMFAPLLILDKGLDFWQALECSRRVVTRHWWLCGGLFLLAVLVVAAGLLACVVGAVVTLPLATAAIVVAYEEIFGARPTTGSGGQRPPVERPPDLPEQSAPEESPAAARPAASTPLPTPADQGTAPAGASEADSPRPAATPPSPVPETKLKVATPGESPSEPFAGQPRPDAAPGTEAASPTTALAAGVPGISGADATSPPRPRASPKAARVKNPPANSGSVRVRKKT